jgi:lipopolysaccharide transport system ATP-binding protein
VTEPRHPIAISARAVAKRYKMFSNARQMVAHQFGLRDLPFFDRPEIPEFSALEGVTFDLARGERIGLIGRNGAGKTTLLKLITRSLAPTEGSIDVNGSVQALMSTGIGFHPEFTGRQNIDATLQYYGLHGDAYAAAMDDVIRFVELGKYLDQPYSTYSLGMQSRTQFAVATAFRPDILLIDEVLGAGDGYFAAKSADRMKRLIGSGCTMILVSHSAETILQFCERVIWLRDGSVHRDGPAKPILAEYEQEMADLAKAGAGAKAASLKSTDPFALPATLRTDFVDQHVRAAEPVADAVGREITELRENGMAIRRFPGKDGVRIADVALRRTGEESGGLQVGEGIAVRVLLKGPANEAMALRCHTLVYSLSGDRLARAGGEIECRFDTSGSGAVEGLIEPLQLGPGQFVVSILVEDARLPELVEEARYDLWSRCAALSYAPTNESDPPQILFDGLVQQGTSEAERTRLLGMT